MVTSCRTWVRFAISRLAASSLAEGECAAATASERAVVAAPSAVSASPIVAQASAEAAAVARIAALFIETHELPG